jgi:hypothetical protein
MRDLLHHIRLVLVDLLEPRAHGVEGAQDHADLVVGADRYGMVIAPRCVPCWRSWVKGAEIAWVIRKATIMVASSAPRTRMTPTWRDCVVFRSTRASTWPIVAWFSCTIRSGRCAQLPCCP